jgi:hypothetical protein
MISFSHLGDEANNFCSSSQVNHRSIRLFTFSFETFATIFFPIDPSNDPGTPTVPRWYLDESSGIWIQEGIASRSGNNWVATVSHFSYNNVDNPIDPAIRSWKTVFVVDANGNPVPNAHVFLRGSGYGADGFTGSDGVIHFATVVGDTIRVRAEKGILKSTEITETAASTRGTFKDNTITLTPPRISTTLTWGINPHDLDAHMTGPTEAGGRFHVWYSNKGSLDSAPYCALDTDDTSSYGPENITVTKLIPGVYRFSVHNYSGQGTFPMENSGATINLIAPGGIIRRYTIPTNNSTNGNTWVVFELTADAQGNVTIADINNFVTTDPSGGAVAEILKR